MDDQTQQRVRFESEMILRILERCECGEWDLVGSTAVNYEINKNPDEEKRKSAYAFYNYVKTIYNVNDFSGAQVRANEFQKLVVGPIDSLHLAMAEFADAEILLSTDDKFVKSSKRTDSKVRVVNPLIWIMEVTDNEQN